MAKGKIEYIVKGKITSVEKKGVKGLIVRAFDQDTFGKADVLGKPVRTNANGEYSISFSEGEFRKTTQEKGGPDVFIEVYLGDEILMKSPIKKNAGESTTIDLKLDKPLPIQGDPERRVFGKVGDKYGELLSNVTVKLFDKVLRKENLLGEVIAKNGQYELKYKKSQFLRPENDYVDLVIKLFKRDKELFASATQYKVLKDLELNINIGGGDYKGPSEYERLTESICLILDGLSPVDLVENENNQDVSYLAGETGYASHIIGSWVASHHIANNCSLSAVEIYGYLRQGQGAFTYQLLLESFKHPERFPLLIEKVLSTLANIQPELQKAILQKAVQDNLIPKRTLSGIDRVQKTLSDLKLKYMAEKSYGAGYGTINELLEIVPDAKKVID